MATIETPRLLLRHWRDSDIEPWVAMNLDPRVTEFFTSEYTRAIVESAAAFAGVVALGEVPFEAHFTPAREVGWRFAPEHWGNGYATEGARGALEYALATLGWDEVVAMTAAQNVRSQRVMQRLGMTRYPNDDFDHPNVAEGHPLRRHVLYRLGL